MKPTLNALSAAVLLAVTTAPLAVTASAQAQAPPPAPAQRPPQPGPQVVSPEVLADRRVTFRLLAPQADTVQLTSSDIPGPLLGGGTPAGFGGPAAAMTKNADGVWETTVGPLPPGAYRYTFRLGGVSVVDPRNPAASESVGNTWSLVDVPGSDTFDTRNVPHGAVASVTYYSTALGRFRRMHVYTPPGYESGSAKYPVFYLLHGAGDSDDSWATAGRAGFILDNLIADKKAVPMVVVMPAGHTGASGMGGPRPAAGGTPPRDEFVDDFLTDVMPYVEKNYRTLHDRPHRAIAGLSMGGGQTLDIAIPHLDRFAYIGVFSSGAFGAFPLRFGPAAAAPPPAGPSAWEQRNMTQLQDAGLKKGLRLLWFSTGREDFLLQTTRSTVDMMKKYGFTPVFEESEGAHTWLNWRDYLAKFAPQLFH